MVMRLRKQGRPKATSRRLERMSTADLVAWFDVDLMGLGAAFDQFRLHDGPPGEVTLRMEQLYKIWEEISARTLEQ